jgi:hypothetical protein
MQARVKAVNYARRTGRQGVLQTLLFFLGRMAEEGVGVLLASRRQSSVQARATQMGYGGATGKRLQLAANRKEQAPWPTGRPPY